MTLIFELGKGLGSICCFGFKKKKKKLVDNKI